MSLTRRRSEALNFDHKWAMYNTFIGTQYRDTYGGTQALTKQIGSTIYIGGSYGFNTVNGRYTLGYNSRRIIITEDNMSTIVGQYTAGNPLSRYSDIMYHADIVRTVFIEGSLWVEIEGEYRYAEEYQSKVRGDTLLGYVYGEAGTYPDNNYVGDTWYVKIY